MSTQVQWQKDSILQNQFPALTVPDALADVSWDSSATTQKALVLQAKPVQTANMLEIQDSTGAVLFAVSAGGSLVKVGGQTLAAWPVNANGFLKNDGAGNLSWAATAASVAWDGISNPVGNQSLVMAATTTTWTWTSTAAARFADGRYTFSNAILASQINFGTGLTGKGGFLTSRADGEAVISGGAVFDGTNWKAQSTTSSAVLCQNGTIQFFGDTGLVVGNSFTPTNQMYMDAIGRLGIGNPTPTFKLDVCDTVASTQIRFGKTTTNVGGYLSSRADSEAIVSGGAWNDGTNWSATATTSSAVLCQNGTVQFFGNSGLTVGNTFSPTSRIYMDAAGKLGINCTPSAMFEMSSGTGATDRNVSIVPVGNASLEISCYQTTTGNLRDINVNGLTFNVKTNPGASGVGTTAFIVDGTGNNVLGLASRPVNATDGFAYLPVYAGAVGSPPTGVPTAYAGFAPVHIQVDAGGGVYKLWAYVNGAWKAALLT